MSPARPSDRGFRVSRDFATENRSADPTAAELVINLLLTAALLG
jgi:hypothetical protein